MATATTNRPPAKQAKKPMTDTTRRQPAWTGSRSSASFSPGLHPVRLPDPQTNLQGSFPPLNGRQAAPDTVLQSLAGLTGTTITLVTRTGQRHEGVIASTANEGDTAGVTLKDVKDILTPGAPLKDQLFIASTNIESWSSGPADAKPPNGDAFKLDSDISALAQQPSVARKERELQAWQPDSPNPAGTSDSVGSGARGDDVTFGPGVPGGNWNQFEANEKLFGVTAGFDEDVYTTKLDRNAPDYKERERKAQMIANEIIGAATNNPHIAEERNVHHDDSGVNEEDKYGAVVRGQNAYVPPGARRGTSISSNGTPAAPVITNGAKVEIPKVSVNAPDGAAIAQTPPSTTRVTSPAATSSPAAKPPADPIPAFRDFVSDEKRRLTQKRQAIVKNEMDKRKAELLKFSQTFKLNKPIPEDLVSILAKDEEKQRQIREKSTQDATSAAARAIGVSAILHTTKPTGSPTPAAAAPPVRPTEPLRKTSTVTPSVATKTPAITKTSSNDVKPRVPIGMVIQPIPPFNRAKAKSPNPGGTPPTGTPSATGPPATPASPMSPNSIAAANRLNAQASSFRPNPKAVAFTPVTAPGGPSTSTSPSASASPKSKPSETSQSPQQNQYNPFFGTRSVKKGPPVNIKDDFNPFKYNKVAEASAVSAIWPYNGKRYMQMFPPPPPQPPQPSPHMAPPGPPPPPPPYEEDPQQAAARGGYVVYPYSPYYPGQPMMTGMPPPGPPGAYMPGPYMQHMPYPAPMPPNGQPMYASPAMGQMPPPQAYMSAPGPYPSPNGAGPRPSMPPTPIPAHAHPYYHQSPQLQHAVPYPMMMPPPGPNGPHPYETGPPPVSMGGHA